MRRHGVQLAAIFALPAAAFVVALIGADRGHFLDLEATSEWCTRGALYSPSLTQTVVPLSAICHYADGTQEQLVPAWVNPTLAVLTTGWLLALGWLVRDVVAALREPTDRVNL